MQKHNHYHYDILCCPRLFNSNIYLPYKLIMIKLPRSIFLLAKVRGSSILDTALKDERPQPMKLLHQQTQGYFNNDHYFFEEGSTLQTYGKSIQQGREVCNFKHYGNLLLKDMLQCLGQVFNQTELQKYDIDKISDQMQMDKVALKFYEKREELLNQSIKQWKQKSASKIWQEALFKQDFREHIKMYFHLMCRHAPQNQKFPKLILLSTYIRQIQENLATKIMRQISFVVQKNILNNDLRQHMWDFLEKRKQVIWNATQEKGNQNQQSYLADSKYPQILINEIQSLFTYGQGFVVSQQLGQQRMKQNSQLNPKTVFNPIFQVTKEIFPAILNFHYGVSIIGQKKISKSYSILLFYLLSKYTVDPLFYFSNVEMVGKYSQIAKRMFECSYINLSKEQIDDLAEIFETANLSQPISIQERLFGTHHFDQSKKTLERVFLQKEHAQYFKKIGTKQISILQRCSPRQVLFDQCNYLTSKVKAKEENYDLVLKNFLIIIKVMSDKLKGSIYSSSINVENDRLMKLIKIAKFNTNRQQWAKVPFLQQITNKNCLKQMFNFQSNILLLKQQQIKADCKRFEQFIKSKQFKTFLQDFVNSNEFIDGLNYDDIQTGVKSIYTYIEMDKTINIPTISTEKLKEIITNSIIDRKLQDLMEVTERWLSYPAQGNIFKISQDQKKLGEVQREETQTQKLDRKIVNLFYFLENRGLPQKLKKNQLKENYPLHLLNRSGHSLTTFIMNHSALFYERFSSRFEDKLGQIILLKLIAELTMEKDSKAHGQVGHYLQRLIQKIISDSSTRQHINSLISKTFDGLQNKPITIRSLQTQIDNQYRNKIYKGESNTGQQKWSVSQLDTQKYKSNRHLHYNQFMMKKMIEYCKLKHKAENQETDETAIVYYCSTLTGQQKCDGVFCYYANGNIHFVFHQIGVNKQVQNIPLYLSFGKKLIDNLFLSEQKLDQEQKVHSSWSQAQAGQNHSSDNGKIQPTESAQNRLQAKQPITKPMQPTEPTKSSKLSKPKWKFMITTANQDSLRLSNQMKECKKNDSDNIITIQKFDKHLGNKQYSEKVQTQFKKKVEKMLTELKSQRDKDILQKIIINHPKDFQPKLKDIQFI